MNPEDGTVDVSNESQSSIELSRDAKGVYRWTVKLYFNAADTKVTAAAQRRLFEIDDWLRSEYMARTDELDRIPL
jgi:hypothetical protein